MKKSVRNLFLGMVLTSVVFACGSDDDAGASGNIGTYAGNILVVDDPQSQLGYILNAKVAVSLSGGNATIKITGDPGFEREYTGKVESQLNGDYYMINITKQTKPVEKIAGDDVVISDNKLSISIDLASDEVTVYDEPVGDPKITIKGKLELTGAGLLKE